MKSFSIAIVFLTSLFFVTPHSVTGSQKPYRKPAAKYCEKPLPFKHSGNLLPKISHVTPHPSELKKQPKQTHTISPSDKTKKLITEQSRIKKELDAIAATLTVLGTKQSANVLQAGKQVAMDQATINTVIYNLRIQEATDKFTEKVNCAAKAIVQQNDLVLAKEFVAKCASSKVVLDQTVKEGLTQLLQNKSTELTNALQAQKAQSITLQKTNTKAAHPNTTQQHAFSERDEKKNRYERENSDENKQNGAVQDIPDTWDNE